MDKNAQKPENYYIEKNFIRALHTPVGPHEAIKWMAYEELKEARNTGNTANIITATTKLVNDICKEKQRLIWLILPTPTQRRQ